jgi:hypothetical protein
MAHMELNRLSGQFAVEFQAEIHKIDLLASCVLRHETWKTTVCSKRMVEDITFDQFYDSAASHLTDLATKRIPDLTNLTRCANESHHSFAPSHKLADRGMAIPTYFQLYGTRTSSAGMLDASSGAGGIRGGGGRVAHSSYRVTAPDRTRPC